MRLNVRTVTQFAKLFEGKNTGVIGQKIGKNMVTYMKYGNQITKTVVRADGHTITGKFEQVAGKWRPAEVVQQNANGVIKTNLMPYGVRATTVVPASNQALSATRVSNSSNNSIYTMSIDSGKTSVQTNNLAFNGLLQGILNFKRS